LWKFTIEENDNTSISNNKLKNPLKLDSNKINVMKQDGSICSYEILLETVISGHDGWVYEVHWKPNIYSGHYKQN